MHDLMHDLATQVGEARYAVLETNKKSNFNKATRHVSFDFHLDSSQKVPTTLFEANKIRTILLLRQSSRKIQGRHGQSVCDVIVSSFKSVRLLDLHNLGIKIVPNCIGKLKHLRYLDLSENEDIKILPDSITMLYNLQTLKLSYCTKLQELPRDLNKPVNLVSLEIDMCNSLTHMPGGLGQLTNLQTLPLFVLKEGTSRTTIKSKHSCDHEVGELSDLMGLNNIGGKLSIINLGNGDQDSKTANLKDKQHLCSLYLCWHVDYDYGKLYWDLVDGHVNVNDDLHLPSYLKDVEYEATLEGLEPHTNLKGLCLEYYEGVEFPSWLPSHANLECLFLKNSLKCQYLPPLNGLVSLKTLNLEGVLRLEYISNAPPASSTVSVLLPALEILEFIRLPSLKGWWRRTDINDCKDGVSMNDHVSLSFPRLNRLIIIGCPKLNLLPLSPNIKNLLVQNNIWKPFQLAVLTASTFSNLSLLALYEIEDLQSLPEWLKYLTCLRNLGIIRCNNLTSLSPGIQQLASSLEGLRIDDCQQLDMFNDVGDLNFWKALTSLCSLELRWSSQLKTHLPQGIQHLTSLQELRIEYCSNLISIDSEWITNLKSLNALTIRACPNLTSLPQGIRHLTSLHTLEIVDCPILFKTCQTDIGEHWPKVAQVPNFILKSTTTSDDDDSQTTSTFLGCNWNVFNKIRIPQFSNKRT